MTPDFSVVEEFEKKIAEFFGASFAVAVDSCTSGLELCLRLVKATHISCPRNTYLSVPMLADKLNISLLWKKENFDWEDYYNIYYTRKSGETINIYDAAVLWKRNGYLKGSMMCVSMQYQKHLSIGRLGVILLDDKEKAVKLKRMSYDGRVPGIPWRDQNVDMIGYHYYAQIELCKLALEKLPKAIENVPRKWHYLDWPDISEMNIFKNR